MFRDGQVVDDGGTSGEPGSAGAGAMNDEQCERLHLRLKKIVKARGALDLAEAAALREAQRLVIWRRYGYASLIEYMELEMGYSPRAAIERLRVANAIVDLPKIADAMEQGELSFSAARELTRVATPDNEEEWLGVTCNLNLRDVEEAVSGHKRGDKPTDAPDPALKKKVLRFEVNPEVVAVWRQVRLAIEKEKGERLDDSAVIEVLAHTFLGERMQTKRDVAPYRVSVMVCERCERGWQDGAGTVVEMSPASVARAQCDASHEGHIDVEPRRAMRASVECGEPDGLGGGGAAVTGTPTSPLALAPATSGPAGARGAAPKADRAKRTIPAGLRKKVNRRDHGRCQVPWCRSARNCDIHHLDPWALGGQHTLENMITLCEAHHLAHHEGALSIRREGGRFVIVRVEQSSFTRETHAVETKQALKSLGFKSDEVREAVERTRTHVGTAELPLDQWIRIALSHCPKGQTAKRK
jgi:hypothetical protein